MNRGLLMEEKGGGVCVDGGRGEKEVDRLVCFCFGWVFVHLADGGGWEGGGGGRGEGGGRDWGNDKVGKGRRCYGIEEPQKLFMPLQRFAFLFFASTHPRSRS